MAEKCPYCGAEMETGILHHRGGFFLPEGEKMPWTYFEKSLKKRNAIELPLDDGFSFVPEYPKAYACRKCKKIIVPYK